MNTSKNELFEGFYPTARSVAEWMLRKKPELTRLYEVDDLINWAFISDQWPKYIGNQGALTVVIKMAMLRALEKDQQHKRGPDPLGLLAPSEEDDPVDVAAEHELEEWIRGKKELTQIEKDVLLRRLYDGGNYSKISKSMGKSSTAMSRAFQRGALKIRGFVVYG